MAKTSPQPAATSSRDDELDKYWHAVGARIIEELDRDPEVQKEMAAFARDSQRRRQRTS